MFAIAESNLSLGSGKTQSLSVVLSFRGEGGRHIKVDPHCKSTGGRGKAKASEV